MYEIDRMVAIVHPTQYFAEWLNKNCNKDDQVKLSEIQTDCTVLVIPLFESTEEAEDYLETIYQDIFENELESWCLDEDLWPKKRTLELFNKWFHIDLHSFVYDTTMLEDFGEQGFSQGGGTTLQ